jgi:hypothetical protein
VSSPRKRHQLARRDIEPSSAMPRFADSLEGICGSLGRKLEQQIHCVKINFEIIALHRMQQALTSRFSANSLARELSPGGDSVYEPAIGLSMMSKRKPSLPAAFNGPRCGRGACGSPNARACCARSSRSRASLQVFCIECGSAKPTSTSASVPRSRNDSDCSLRSDRCTMIED